MASYLSRKKELKEPDEFQDVVMHIVAWIKKEKKKLISLLLISTLGVAIGLGLFYYLNDKKEKAILLEAEALENYYSALKGSDNNQQEEKVVQTKTAEEKYKKALELFSKEIDTYTWTDCGKRALYYIGSCYYYLKDYSPAEKYYLEYLKKYPKDGLFSRAALRDLGYLFEGQKKYDEALVYYQKILTFYPRKMENDQVYLDLGRCYDALNKTKEAKEVYEKAIAEFPETSWKGEIDKKLENLKRKEVCN
ncbi:MAG: tetratricopeptide repeat protein [bacterium]